MLYREFRSPDLHMHSVFSDGSDSPAELLSNARAAGLDIFSLTDHDTAEGCAAVQALLRPGDPCFIPGVEFSCRDTGGKYHILGYGCNADRPSVQAATALAHASRMQKADSRLAYLAETHGFTFTPEEIAALKARKNPGKPHFAAMLVEHGYVGTREEGFAVMAGYRGTERYLTPEEAIIAILDAEGIPVLAHGILADGSLDLPEPEITGRVDRLKAAGLMGLEGYYSTYTPRQQDIMLALAERYDLLVTAGSDYHGTAKSVALGQTNHPDPVRMQRFYRAVACLL